MIDLLSTSHTICAILLFSMFIMLIGFSLWIESKNGTSKIEVQTISKEPLVHKSSIDLRKTHLIRTHFDSDVDAYWIWNGDCEWYGNTRNCK